MMVLLKVVGPALRASSCDMRISETMQSETSGFEGRQRLERLPKNDRAFRLGSLGHGTCPAALRGRRRAPLGMRAPPH